MQRTDNGEQRQVEGRWPASPMQEALWLGTQGKGTALELHQIVIEWGDASLDVKRMTSAWQNLTRRHAVLRSRFVWDASRGTELEVLRDVEVDAQQVQATTLDAFLAADRAHGLVLDSAPQWRLSFVRHGAGTAVVMTHHHALLDGRAQRELVAQAMQRYGASGDDAITRLINDATPSAQPFLDHLRALTQRERAAERGYFERLLDGAEPTFLPSTAVAPARADVSANANATTTTPASPNDPITRDEVTLSMPWLWSGAAEAREGSTSAHDAASWANIVQLAWAHLLCAHGWRDDVCFGVTRNGRHLVPGAVDAIGCFINTVPMRVSLTAEATQAELLASLREQTVAVRPFEHASLSEVQHWVHSEGPLFDSIVVCDQGSMEGWMRQRGDAHRRYRVLQQSSFPIVLAAYLDEGQSPTLSLALEFDPQKWSRASMQLMLRRLERIMTQLVQAPHQRVRELDLLVGDESQDLTRWSRGDLVGAKDTHDAAPSTVVAALARQVATRPQATAYVQGDGVPRSYADLAVRAAQLGQGLSPSMVKRGAVLALMMDSSFDLLALQCAAYAHAWTVLVIDPAWPLARVRGVLQAARPAVLVTGDSLSCADVVNDLATLPGAPRHRDISEAPWHAAAASGPSTVPSNVATTPTLPQLATPADAAYLMFTSGSTGKPKGAVIDHAALVAHGHGAARCYALGADDRVLQFASPAFDVAIEETMPTLMAGGTVVGSPLGRIPEHAQLLAWADAQRVTVLNLPSGYFDGLVAHLESTQAVWPSSVHTVIVGSEKTSAQRVLAFHQRLPEVRLFNAYGLTEATISSVACDVSAWLNAGGEFVNHHVPMGRPFGLNEVVLVDRHGRIAPSDVPAEIGLLGPQLARGYLGVEHDATSRFTTSPIDGRRMYRSGDLGRWRHDGLLEYLGRGDDQVKVRGVRIELGEIESTLMQLDVVMDAVVVTRPTRRGLELVAFVLPASEVPIDTVAVKSELAKQLPPAYLPSEIRSLTRWPVSPTGKIDRRALQREAETPLPRAATVSTAQDLDEPRSDLEVCIQSLFISLLGVEHVGVHDNFFDLGGHSLLAVRLSGALSQLGSRATVPLAAVFSQPTVRGLAALVDSLSDGAPLLPSIVPLNARAHAMLHGETTNDRESASRSNRDEPVPTFWVCGVQIYALLGRAMQDDRAAFGVFVELEKDLLMGNESRVDVAHLAQAYIDAVKKVRPQGPYILGGFSFGGLMAYEMAQQLRARGEEVHSLVLLDTILSRAFPPKKWLTRLADSVSNLTWRLLRVDARDAVKQWLGGRGWISHSDHQRLIGMDKQRDRIYRFAAQDYDAQITPYAGRVVFCRAEVLFTEGGGTVAADLGWPGLVPEPTRFHTVPGEHLDVLREEGANAIARVLRREMLAAAVESAESSR